MPVLVVTDPSAAALATSSEETRVVNDKSPALRSAAIEATATTIADSSVDKRVVSEVSAFPLARAAAESED
jgi:hypothetical protein